MTHDWKISWAPSDGTWRANCSGFPTPLSMTCAVMWKNLCNFRDDLKGYASSWFREQIDTPRLASTQPSQMYSGRCLVAARPLNQSQGAQTLQAATQAKLMGTLHKPLFAPLLPEHAYKQGYIEPASAAVAPFAAPQHWRRSAKRSQRCTRRMSFA